MSKIDYQALREAAEKATPGRVGDRIDGSGSIKYECHGYDGSLVLRTDHKNMEYGFIGDNSNADELFFRLCVPDVIPALLDELEAADNNLIDSECRVAELEEALRDKQALLEASEKLIAELEKSEEQLINERDHAESALADMYFAATGNRPEWSNWFGFSDAVDAVVDRIADLEAKQPSTVSVPDAAEAIRACIDEFPESVRDIVEECASIAENAYRAAMPQGTEPATDNTNQQFESLSRGDK